MYVHWSSAPRGSYSYIPYAKSNVTVPWRSMQAGVSVKSQSHPLTTPMTTTEATSNECWFWSIVLDIFRGGMFIIPLPFQRPSADYSSAVILIWITF